MSKSVVTISDDIQHCKSGITFWWKAAVLCVSIVGMNPGTDASTDSVVSSKTVVVTCLGIGALFFLLNDLLGLINGGGVFSAMIAVEAAHSHALSLDVDAASFRTPFVILCAFFTTTTCMMFRLKLKKRWTQLIFMLGVIGGGFVLDAICGPRMIENYLNRNGYHRCSSRDHTVGGGKGRVWFDNYVLHNTECIADT